MTGLVCWMCGFDQMTIKKPLVSLKVFDDKGKEKEVTTCPDCKIIALAGNHPTNQNLGEAPADQGGFIKPSNSDGNYPPVRPQ